jgi:transcriptional regulator with XRE-family HTH domain
VQTTRSPKYRRVVDHASDLFAGWAAQQASDIGVRVAQRRKDLNLSAEKLAQRCAQLGMPGFTRQVIMRLEHDRRETVTVSELSVLAAALAISPVLLLYPLGRTDVTEYLPGHKAEVLDAVRWWSGEVLVGTDGSIADEHRRLPVDLFRDHRQILGEMPADLTEAAYVRARRGQWRPGVSHEDQRAVGVVVALVEARTEIREAGLIPPELPEHLAWVDEPAI